MGSLWRADESVGPSAGIASWAGWGGIGSGAGRKRWGDKERQGGRCVWAGRRSRFGSHPGILMGEGGVESSSRGLGNVSRQFRRPQLALEVLLVDRGQRCF